jgi:hypothetical protein
VNEGISDAKELLPRLSVQAVHQGAADEELRVLGESEPAARLPVSPLRNGVPNRRNDRGACRPQDCQEMTGGPDAMPVLRMPEDLRRDGSLEVRPDSPAADSPEGMPDVRQATHDDRAAALDAQPGHGAEQTHQKDGWLIRLTGAADLNAVRTLLKALGRRLGLKVVEIQAPTQSPATPRRLARRSPYST